jgi:hypothetical protein
VDSDSMAAGADSCLAGGAVLEPVSAGSLASEASPFLEGVSGFLSPPASSMEKDSNAETSSPSSTRTAMGCRLLVIPVIPQWPVSTGKCPKPVSRMTYASNSNVLLARVAQNLGESAILLELKVHLCLVGLDLDEHVAGRYRVSGLLLPCANVSGGHGRGECGHADDGVRWVGCRQTGLAYRPLQ